MKWVLLIVLMNGGVDSVEFNNEDACHSASIAINLAAASNVFKFDGYTPHVAAICKPMGDAK